MLGFIIALLIAIGKILESGNKLLKHSNQLLEIIADK
jgi:hypothetical protein